MSWRAILNDSGFVPAWRLTVFLWAFGYTLLETVLLVGKGGRPDMSIVSSALQFLTAVGLSSVLIGVVLATRRWSRLRRTLAVIATLVVVLALQTLIDISSNWTFATFVDVRMREWAQFSWDRYLRSGFVYMWVYALNLGLIYLSLANTRVRDQQQEIADARSAAAQAQLAMLRYQLNPHFLFNTLNAISTLVVTRRNEDAEEMLGKLSSFLRASLASESDDYVSLDAELDVIREYLDIEGVRFGERLVTDFACDPQAGAMLVPSFLLQPLVENAIKYAVGPATRTVTVKIDARIDGRDLIIMVADDGDAAKSETRGGTGVGLKNVRGRLEALYGSRASLEAVPLERGFLAIVRLPATAPVTPIARTAG